MGRNRNTVGNLVNNVQFLDAYLICSERNVRVVKSTVPFDVRTLDGLTYFIEQVNAWDVNAIAFNNVN